MRARTPCPPLSLLSHLTARTGSPPGLPCGHPRRARTLASCTRIARHFHTHTSSTPLPPRPTAAPSLLRARGVLSGSAASAGAMLTVGDRGRRMPTTPAADDDDGPEPACTATAAAAAQPRRAARRAQRARGQSAAGPPAARTHRGWHVFTCSRVLVHNSRVRLMRRVRLQGESPRPRDRPVTRLRVELCWS